MIQSGQTTKERYQSCKRLTLGSNIMIGSMITLKINEKEYLTNLKSIRNVEVTQLSLPQ